MFKKFCKEIIATALIILLCCMIFYRHLFLDISDFFADHQAFSLLVFTTAIISNVIAVKWIIGVYKSEGA